MTRRVLVLAGLWAARAAAQPADTISLADIRAAAAAHDPRSVQPALLEAASAARLAALRAQRLPTLSVTGQATYQDDVARVPIELPVDPPTAPLEQFRVQLEAEQLLFDGGRLALRADVERAALAESRAAVQVTVNSLRDAATEAYFGALLALSRAQAIQLTVNAIQARRELLHQRVEQGAALRAEAAELDAEWLRLVQQFQEADASHRAATSVLALLTGLDIRPYFAHEVPGEELAIADGGVTVDTTGRAEFGRFAATRARAVAESRLAAAATRPDVRLFGQAGAGRPGPFRPFEDSVDPFAVVGLRAAWNVVDWGRSRRQAEAALVQARIAQSESDAFARGLERAVEGDRADIRRLLASAELDDQIVALREHAHEVAQAQFEEGVLNAADYSDRLIDLQDARLTRERHRIELARARARVLSTLGRFPGDSP